MLLAICVVWALPAAPASAATHEMEYITDEQLPEPIYPEGDDTVYMVVFYFLRGAIVDYPALEGHGVGGAQWISDPARGNYSFVGWYNNPEGTGERYSANTPIYEDTDLYATWKYTGPGGYWPRPYHGVVHGITDGGSSPVNEKIAITAEGHNMHLTEPNDQRCRWAPIAWRVDNAASGGFSGETPYSAEFSISAAGEYTLFVTYKEEIYDGIRWQETGQVRETPEALFQITG